MDAIELLKSDHDKVEAIFQQFQLGGNTQQFSQLFSQLYQELSLHSLAEEAVVYPALAKFDEMANQVKDVFVDHAEAKAALAELAALDNTSNEWSQKMTKLMQDIQAHVREEEGQIFPFLLQRMSQEQLNTLGEEVQKAKQLNTPGVQASLPMKELGMSNMPMSQFDSDSSQYA